MSKKQLYLATALMGKTIDLIIMRYKWRDPIYVSIPDNGIDSRRIQAERYISKLKRPIIDWDFVS